MCSQPNDYFLESFWSLKKAVARLWSPEPRLVNLNSAAVNLPFSSATPTSRTQTNRAVDASPTIANEVPDNTVAHQVTIGYDQEKHYTEETGDRSRNSLLSPKISFTVANKSYIVTPSIHPPTLNTYPSNLPIERGLASADNDSHVLKHQSVNISTTNTDISTTVPLNAKISLAFSTVDDAETAVNGVISLTFPLMKSISILTSLNFTGDQAEGPSHETVQPLQQPFPIMSGLCSVEILIFNVTDSIGTGGSSNLPIVDPPRLKSSGKCYN